MNQDQQSSSGRKRVRKLAGFLDAKFEIAGIKLGYDSIIGLIPGVGDGAASLLAAYIVYEALEHNMSKATLLRMIGNILIDSLLGSIPLLGDLFDIFWKANQKNAALFERELSMPRSTERRSILWVGAVVVVLLSALALAVYLPVKLLITLFN